MKAKEYHCPDCGSHHTRANPTFEHNLRRQAEDALLWKVGLWSYPAWVIALRFWLGWEWHLLISVAIFPASVTGAIL